MVRISSQLVLTCMLFSFSSCWMVRAYKVRKLRLTDHEKLPSVQIGKSDQPAPFINPGNKTQYRGLQIQLDSILETTETGAFLVIKNDSIVYERYAMGLNEKSLLPSNSMAKSFVGTLALIAIDEGAIKSDSEPITNYLPELAKKDPRFAEISIRHLLNMRSGLDFKEGSYDLHDDAIKLGLKRNLEKNILKKAKIAGPPGNFRYQSINTQLLGIIIERATGKKLQNYLEEKLWTKIGTESNATWNVDSKKRKHVLTSAGINAVARDFARLGRLYLAKGKMNGQQIINSRWIQAIANPDSMEMNGGYKNQWWSRRVSQLHNDSLGSQRNYRTEAFNASGFMRQIIYIHPIKNVIIVRLGRGWPRSPSFTRFIYSLGESL